MAEVWPSTLPQDFLVDGYSEGIADVRLRSQMDVGPAKVRRRSSAGVRPLSGNMNLTGEQLSALETFINVTTQGGTLAFTFPDPRSDGDLLCRFSENMPTWTIVGPNIYSVSLQLEVLP